MVDLGGASAVAMVWRAAVAIELGLCDADPDPDGQAVLGRFGRAQDSHPVLAVVGPVRVLPRVLAPGTLADDLEWREIGGAASLYTFTVAYRPVAPHFAADVPQILAVAQWNEGPRFSTEIVNAEPGNLSVGMRLTPVFFDYPDDGVTMLRYEPA